MVRYHAATNNLIRLLCALNIKSAEQYMGDEDYVWIQDTTHDYTCCEDCG